MSDKEEALATQRKEILEEVREAIACYSKISDIQTKELIKQIAKLSSLNES